MSTAKGFPKQACANTSFVSIEMPLSLPMMCQKGHIVPCGAGDSLDHLTKRGGQEAGRWGTDRQMTRETHPIQSVLPLGGKELGSVYFFPDLFLFIETWKHRPLDPSDEHKVGFPKPWHRRVDRRPASALVVGESFGCTCYLLTTWGRNTGGMNVGRS